MLQGTGGRCQLFSPPPFAGRWISPAAFSGPRQLGKVGVQRPPVSSHVSLQCGFLSIRCRVASKGGIREGRELREALLCCQSLSHPEAGELRSALVQRLCDLLQPPASPLIRVSTISCSVPQPHVNN